MISNPLLQLLSGIIGIYSMLLLARLNLAWTKAGLSNPVIVSIYRATQPIVLPLKKFIRNIGRFETASFVLLVVLAIVDAGLSTNFSASISSWLINAVKILVDWIYYFYLIAILIMVVLSWIITDPYHPVYTTLHRITDPILAPTRKLLMRITGNLGLDFSPMIVIILLGFIRSVISNYLYQLL